MKVKAGNIKVSYFSGGESNDANPDVPLHDSPHVSADQSQCRRVGRMFRFSQPRPLDSLAAPPARLTNTSVGTVRAASRRSGGLATTRRHGTRQVRAGDLRRLMGLLLTTATGGSRPQPRRPHLDGSYGSASTLTSKRNAPRCCTPSTNCRLMLSPDASMNYT